MNSVSLNYLVSSRSRTLLLVLLLKLLNPVILVPSYALSTGSESLNASNTSSCHLPTKFSQLPTLHTFVALSYSTSSQYSRYIRRYSCSITVIILFKNNLSVLPLCFSLSLESTPFISSSTSLWYRFLHFRLTYSLTHHFSFDSPFCS